jgi:hypothetical protein
MRFTWNFVPGTDKLTYKKGDNRSLFLNRGFVLKPIWTIYFMAAIGRSSAFSGGIRDIPKTQLRSHSPVKIPHHLYLFRIFQEGLFGK